MEEGLRKQQEVTGEAPLTDSTKRALLIKMVPDDLGKYLKLNAGRLNSYDKARWEVMSYITNEAPQADIGMQVDSFDETGAEEWTADWPEWPGDDLELGAFGKGGWQLKGKGKSKGKGKGKGKGDKGKGKGGVESEFWGTCFWCQEQGHRAVDCEKKKAWKRQQGGRIGELSHGGGECDVMGALELCPIFEDSEDPWADTDPWLKALPPKDSVDERIRKLKSSLETQTPEPPPGLTPSPAASKGANSQAPGGAPAAPAASESLVDRIKALRNSLENSYEENNHNNRDNDDQENNNNHNNDNFNNKNDHHDQSDGNDKIEGDNHNNNNNNVDHNNVNNKDNHHDQTSGNEQTDHTNHHNNHDNHDQENNNNHNNDNFNNKNNHHDQSDGNDKIEGDNDNNNNDNNNNNNNNVNNEDNHHDQTSGNEQTDHTNHNNHNH